ncbi:unnamed protein product [Brugia pahangi]|uniref:BRCT domain-containing protein n=1 Tax=Brugia pahangi TaxID=6280 RepID=A0A158PPV5_BRUPA|nr:unnamed protein product [Brugia pahangi]
MTYLKLCFISLQVPDITGTDNADVMATSMDSIDELPTSEEDQKLVQFAGQSILDDSSNIENPCFQQAVETSALVEQEAELFIKSETDNVEIAPITETEAPIEEERIAIGSEVEIPQELHEAETMLKEKVVPADEATDVNVEAPQNDDKAKELLTEQNPAAPEAESEELEVEGQKETEPEVEHVQDQLKHTEPLEVTEVIQEVVTEQSLATNESEAIMDELSEAAAEEIKKEDLNNERNDPSNVELPNEQQQPMECGNEAEENSFVSALLPEEKSETIHSSHTSSLKFEETSDGPMATPLMTEQEFTFDEDKPVSKTSITDVLSQKMFTTEEKNSSRKTSAMGDEVSSRKVSAIEGEGQDRFSRKVLAMEEKALSRKTSAAEEEKPQSRKSSEVKEKKIPSRKSSVIQEAKTPSRKTSESEEKISSRKTSVVEEEKIASKKSSIAQERVLPRKISSQMDEKAPSRKASKMKSVEENNETTEFSPELAAAPQSERAGRAKITKDESNEAKIEPELEPIVEPKSATEETVVEAEEAKIIAEPPTGKINDEAPFEVDTAEDVENEEKKVPEKEKYAKEEQHAAVNEQYNVLQCGSAFMLFCKTYIVENLNFTDVKLQRESLPPARQIISFPPRRRSPSPVRRDTNRESKYKSYDQDTHRQRGPPPRMPNYLSFSSYIPVEKKAYSPVSPWVQNAAQKYRNDYTAASTYKPKSIYTSIFDDTVNSGPFSSDLYSVNRLLERSRSRSRELRNALRSKRSTSNYYRYTSNYATPPLRTRDYSTPPLSSVYHSSSRSGSFISFMEYSGQKQYELARSPSRFSNFDGLSRASSRSNVDMFYDMERLSRMDSYVRDLNRNTEYGFPSTYVKYRSPSRPYLPQEYTPINGYRAYNSPLSRQRHSVLYNNPYIYNPISVSQSLYESRIADLQRSLSRERLARERMKAKYKTLSHKLDQACRQMDLLRTNSYSSIRGGTGTYSIYTHNYPYF